MPVFAAFRRAYICMPHSQKCWSLSLFHQTGERGATYGCENSFLLSYHHVLIFSFSLLQTYCNKRESFCFRFKFWRTLGDILFFLKVWFLQGGRWARRFGDEMETKVQSSCLGSVRDLAENEHCILRALYLLWPLPWYLTVTITISWYVTKATLTLVCILPG